MADTSGVPLEGCKANATLLKTALSTTAEVHLFKDGFVPTAASTAADFAANEADYDGYAAIAVAAWHDPELNGSAGYMIYGTSVLSFTWVHAADDVENEIRGYWVEDVGGKVRGYTYFQNTVILNGPDQVLPIIPTITSSVFG